MNNLQLSNEQEQALGMMLSGNNVFISGPAGSGKSMIINEFKKSCNLNLVCLAPTGIAAQAIGGTTLHSFFKLPMGIATPDSLNNFDHKQNELLKAVEVILIDEISMCRSDTFQAIEYLLRRTATSDKQYLPFGGTQVIVIGDFYQLPPVVNEMEIQHLEIKFGGIYAFNTVAWDDATFEYIQLNRVYRQQDQADLDMLNAIRYNTPDLDERLHYLNRKLFSTSISYNELCLCTTKRATYEINAMQMDQLPDPGFCNRGNCYGTFPECLLPTERELEIKQGA